MARILYTITKANWGGAQKYVYDCACAARERGHEVLVVYGEDGLLREKLARAGIRTLGVPMQNKASLVTLLSSYRHLRRAYALEKPDIVHVNSSLASAAGACAARRAGVPRIVFTAHGWAFNERRPWWQRGILYLLSWLTIVLSHKTICVSNAVLRDVAWMPFAREKCTVIYNGVAREDLLSKEEARRALAPSTIGRYWIGMLSELHPTKRVEDAVRAVALLKAEHPDVVLLVLGEGRERERLTSLIRDLHLEKQVLLLGHVRDAPRYLKAFDLFVHASRSEALGLALLEAGAASLPVVATRVGGIPEIIPDDDHGLLVPPENPEALARAIETLMNDPLRAHELGARLHARVTREFSLETMLADTITAYER